MSSIRRKRSRNLLAAAPQFLAEWDYELNGAKVPAGYAAYSHSKVWWRCAKDSNHVWLASPANRLYGSGCPYCANKKVDFTNNLAVTHPKLAAQWHPTRNGNVLPTHVTAGSDKEIIWQCERGHAWTAKVFVRKRGSGCPFAITSGSRQKTPLQRSDQTSFQIGIRPRTAN